MYVEKHKTGSEKLELGVLKGVLDSLWDLEENSRNYSEHADTRFLGSNIEDIESLSQRRQ